MTGGNASARGTERRRRSGTPPAALHAKARVDRLVSEMPGSAALPRRNGELVFDSPWESRAFGMVVALHKARLFRWEEFQRRLIGCRQDPRPSVTGLRGLWRCVLALVAIAGLVSLAACGGASGTGSTGSAGQRVSGQSPPGFPVTVDNCGMTTTYEHPPRRAVTIHQHPTEVMLALGLADRMVGTSYLDNPVLPRFEQEYASVPVLAKQAPSLEAVLAVDPDFVYGGYASAFSAESGRSRQHLAELGIDTYLNTENCPDGPVTMADLYQEIRTIGKIFGVHDRAEHLVADMRAPVDRVRERVAGVDQVRVFVYDSGQRAPLTAGGAGIGDTMIELAGGRNIFADLDDTFATVSWEQVIARRPDVIVIYTYSGSASADRKKRFLLGYEPLAQVPAIRHRRIAVLPLTSAVVGVRVPQGVERLARQLHPEAFR